MLQWILEHLFLGEEHVRSFADLGGAPVLSEVMTKLNISLGKKRLTPALSQACNQVRDYCAIFWNLLLSHLARALLRATIPGAPCLVDLAACA